MSLPYVAAETAETKADADWHHPQRRWPRLLHMSAAAAAALILLRLALAWTASEETRVVYLMRHGEKTFNKRNKTAYLYACLSEKGWARAYNLKALFGPQPSPPFRTPSALFAGNYSNPSDCRDEHGWYRTQTTIAPLAAASPGGLDLPVESGTGWLPTLCAAEERGHCRQAAKSGSSPHDYGVCCNTAAARRVKERLAQHGVGAVLVVWEHANIGYLAEELGAPAHELAWPDPEFDLIFALHFRPSGEYLRLERLYQGFTHHTQGYLGPQESCGAVAPLEFEHDPDAYSAAQDELSASG